MSDATATPKAKKSVALSGVIAGNTAICTVGHTGNDLHYRGYDIADVATHATYEEVAHLLVHERLPNTAELHAYREKLKRLRSLPVPLRAVLEQIPATAHPMDVLRTGCSMLGNLEHEKLPSTGAGAASAPGARELADRLLASFPSMLLYWHHFTRHGKRIMVDTADDSIAAHFLHLLHQRPPPSPAPSARSAARSTAAPTRSPTRSSSATPLPTRPRPTSASASPARRSSSASATRSTP
jgi:2-methylcitrate synthase